YIAPKDERDDTIKIQLSDYENGISYEYTIPLIFAGNNEHSLDKFKENLSRLPNS
ncbi:murein transglycosylase, partial [Firmicutes bacterium AF16-15]